MITRCDRCGALETTPASKNARCYFCNKGIMRIANPYHGVSK